MQQQWYYIRTLLGHVPLVIKLLFAVITSGVAAGAIVHIIEPNRFPTLFEGIWWAFITVSTVGYGDFVPESTLARLVAIVLIFVGVGFMTLLVTSFAGAAVSINQSTKEGSISFIGEQHLVIIGWNERARQVIENIHASHPHTRIVLIDETLTELPKTIKQVHFVRGNSSEDAVLKQANIALAKSVLITAKHQGSEFTADAKTILTILAIKGLNRELFTTVEILSTEQMENAYRAGADQCIESNSITGSLLTVSLLHRQMLDVTFHFISYGQFAQVQFVSVKKEEVGMTMPDLLPLYYKRGLHIIGLKRSERLLFHPPPSFLIELHDELVTIKINKAT
ncbi:hypothetical protein JCM9140_4251 [Halalkalibacter wakoensis JCM 9140]|uniref:RCK N-terminal domain-containing protein n=1 Tax=Halalkalibacter wakoensis JCM 9140 TaxID=1236970 RepID=W4Q7U1_9BACI|nr:potassium channel family protein [Halalkalibacter wakoensis]GAE28062.1 hypothetical protein JCM9140_4251 [Halalkalibacter wakoensis JCM 9140]